MKFSTQQGLHDWYDGIYGQDVQYGAAEAHGWVQWKGTDACIDFHCACGESTHVDAEFCYYFKCPTCKRHYAVGQNIKLIPLTEEQIRYAEEEGTGFVP